MGEHLLTRAGALSLIAAFAMVLSANAAFSSSQLKFNIMNNLDFTVTAKADEGSTEISPGDVGTVKGRGMFQGWQRGIVTVTGAGGGASCALEMSWQFEEKSGCKNKSFSNGKKEGCDLVYKYCSGGNNCQCHFDLNSLE